MSDLTGAEMPRKKMMVWAIRPVFPRLCALAFYKKVPSFVPEGENGRKRMTGLECMPVAWHEAPVMKTERPDSRACKTGVIGFGTSSANVIVSRVHHRDV